jgi:hypothetical protein
LELLLLVGRVGVIKTKQKSAVILLVSEVVVEKSSLGVSNVQVSRRLRREASDNTAIGVLQGNVVAGTLLRLRRLLLLGGSGQRIDGSSGPGAELLQESVPAGEVDKRTLLQSSDSNTVTAEGTPQSDIRGRKRVSDDK